MNSISYPLVIFTLALVLLISLACRGKSSTQEAQASTVADDSATADNGFVSFKIHESSRRKVKDGEEVVWDATHVSTVGIARFKIKMIMKKPGGNSPFTITDGSFIREDNSEPSEFLRQVAVALEATNPKRTKSARDHLNFTIAVLGENLTRQLTGEQLAGGFTSNPPGDWMATKVFVADGEGEFFLNLNPKLGMGEISIKDSDYGDIVVQELSRVLSK